MLLLRTHWFFLGELIIIINERASRVAGVFLPPSLTYAQLHTHRHTLHALKVEN